MRIGVISDSHDRADAVESAVALLVAEGVGAIVHLGDVCGPAVGALLHATGIRLFGVFGNCDRDRTALAESTGGAFVEGPRVETMAGRSILFAHSFDELESSIVPGRFDLILFGHTHRVVEMRVGRALVLNPGEACGLSTGRATCAVVDLGTMVARIIGIPLA